MSRDNRAALDSILTAFCVVAVVSIIFGTIGYWAHMDHEEVMKCYEASNNKAKCED